MAPRPGLDLTERTGITDGSTFIHTAWKSFCVWLEWMFAPVQRGLNQAFNFFSRLLDSLDPLRERLEGSRTKKVIQVTIFPLLLALVLGAGFSLVENGLTRRSVLGLFLLLGLYGVILAPLERLIPFSHKWLKSEDASTDLMLFMVTPLWNMWIMRPLSLVTIVVLEEQISPSIGRQIWPDWMHPLAQVFLLLSARGFLVYWYHRGMHASAFMWRWHVVHHSAERLYWLNGSRTHPIQRLVASFLWAVPLAFIQAPVEIVFVTGLLSQSLGRFQHSNLDLILGPLDYIFATPANHRYHHSKKIGERNSNYGGTVIFWDILFGTFHLPKGQQASDDVGIRNMPNFPKSFAGLMLVPFNYGSLKNEAQPQGRSEEHPAEAVEQPG